MPAPSPGTSQFSQFVEYMATFTTLAACDEGHRGEAGFREAIYSELVSYYTTGDDVMLYVCM
jgi:hypothetical protein